jgi:hypothetical protein
MTLESKFQANLIDDWNKLFPEDLILKNDANYLQGIPDILILHEDRWGMLETKRSLISSLRPNQAYYIEKLNRMSYAAFINPSNKERIFDELQRAFRSSRAARILRSQ